MDEAPKYGKLVEDYIDSCKAANNPLNECQIGLLEKLVGSSPDLPPQAIYHPSSPDNQIDMATLTKAAAKWHIKSPKRLVNAIKEFKYGKKDISIDVTDADALELYNFVEKEVKFRDLRDIKKKYQFPQSFGLRSLVMLHGYLQDKGVIDKSKERPHEPRYL
jgi:hypothetical protein